MVEAYGQEEDWEQDDWGDGEEEDWGATGEENYMMEEVKLEAKNSSGLGEEKVFMAGHMKNKYYTIIDSNEIHLEQQKRIAEVASELGVSTDLAAGMLMVAAWRPQGAIDAFFSVEDYIQK